MEATGAGGSISPPPPPPAGGARAPLGELNLLNQYSHHSSNHCWTSIESLAIPNIGSRDASIDLMKHKDYDLVLPPELLYLPTTWEGRKALVKKAITEAAMQQGKTSLIQLNADKKGGRLVLGCNKGRTYYENKHHLKKKKMMTMMEEEEEDSPPHLPAPTGVEELDASKNNTTTTTDCSPFIVPCGVNFQHAVPEYKKGVRQDRIVNKNAACRGGPPPPHQSM